MIKKRTFMITILLIVIGFGIGICLQDLKHKESTEVFWKANRHNISRFTKVKKFTSQMNGRNWHAMRDSIYKEVDTLIILRFRKEMDSLNKLRTNQ